MSTKHTPGPWGVLDEPGHPPLITAWNEADGSTDDIAVLCDETSTTLANAFLIASAPELLAALQRMEDWARTIDDEESRVPFDVRQEAQAAIAKATNPS